jgi:flagellin-specific chaperone FliS
MHTLTLLEPLPQPAPARIQTAHEHYRTQQVLGASPMQLVLMVYDVAIVSCEARDPQRAGKAVGELIGSLNFEYREIATDLFRLYEYCLWEIRQNRFQEAATVLRGLKRAWEDAMTADRATSAPRQSIA